MIRVNIHEIKARLSHYVELVEAGERVVVCRRNVPVAELSSISDSEQPVTPRLGSAAGRGRVLPGFGEPMTEEDPGLRLKRSGVSIAERLNEIAVHCASLPVLDDRSPEEMLYDERGLPK
jgi:prevent-host-death family protein